MEILNKIQDILHNNFLCDDACFEEKGESMRVDVDKSGCGSLIYKFDKNLGREYKGGLFPFFAKVEGVCKISDYIIFAERGRKLYCLIVEMKKGKSQTFPQLLAAYEFAKFVIATLNRVNGTSYSPEYRFISIHGINLIKKGTRVCGVKYDKNNHYILKSNRFLLKMYLV